MEKLSKSEDCHPRIKQHNDGPLFNVTALRFQKCLQLAKNSCYLRDEVEGLQDEGRNCTNVTVTQQRNSNVTIKQFCNKQTVL
jgi:hypothetical protein